MKHLNSSQGYQIGQSRPGRSLSDVYPPLNALRSFEAAARLGSFNQAADELFVTPSAVSHQVKALEAFLGMSLFRREKRKVFLTTAGEKYLVAIQLALDEIDSATRRLMASPNAGAVNIAVAPGLSNPVAGAEIGRLSKTVSGC